MNTFEDFVNDVRSLKKGTEKNYPMMLKDYPLLHWFNDPIAGKEVQGLAVVIRQSKVAFTIKRL